MKPSEYVAEVAEELATNGWIQYSMHEAGRGSCMLGAMVNVTMRDLKDRNGISSRAGRFITELVRKQGASGIPAWNDKPGRTLNEVLDLLHECQIGLKEIECGENSSGSLSAAS